MNTRHSSIAELKRRFEEEKCKLNSTPTERKQELEELAAARRAKTHESEGIRNQPSRLVQANSSINFKQIIAIDKVHDDALHEIDERVENDKITMKI